MAIIIHSIIIILEIIALIHDIGAFGLRMFQYYTIDSNILQLIVSILVLCWILFRKKKLIPIWMVLLHLICAVCLTVTFLIALFVLTPQDGFAYLFLNNVAPINHFLGPVLSVVSFLFIVKSKQAPKKIVIAPMCASLLYGIILLILNAKGIADGPYFFLKVNETPAGTIIMWFAIICALCFGLSALYLWIRGKITKHE